MLHCCMMHSSLMTVSHKSCVYFMIDKNFCYSAVPPPNQCLCFHEQYISRTYRVMIVHVNGGSTCRKANAVCFAFVRQFFAEIRALKVLNGLRDTALSYKGPTRSTCTLLHARAARIWHPPLPSAAAHSTEENTSGAQLCRRARVPVGRFRRYLLVEKS